MSISLLLYGLVAICATAMVITRTAAVHALLYMVVALLALACVFDTLGAPFAALLEVIVYAGAIMVLFVFVVMMLNIGSPAEQREKSWLSGGIWVVPSLLALGLLVTLLIGLRSGAVPAIVQGAAPIGPREVGLALYGPYILTVELSSFLLLAGLVSAFHIGRRIGGAGIAPLHPDGVHVGVNEHRGVDR
ncbi:NADH-quinone oxidoreductase subunit J [Acidomonas methanolica]|uniref:NADH-quinone oxidoreductase subunit J n=1 Tax=Acidomonas methanolica NBRC 104435 TaxID=1231351 RepID=A0A023D3X7_ACIMT|nr:NADH-quinone oxidoreductase subunit J [Acidomonas methanolica]MBU2655015.1 NADH-quinone oxidoreductase subunit J [Acidomonas methanolica]TCS25670.1 NADH dehydrogenase subunit J [Acidomonas methanolica]GAJ28475.1 NADH-quinone oxidoreductase subunit J [Acidomonas methanolica NBRC 104435]GEK99481.1 NADH:ubiquinone oxidoreductase subunit J [Acidomonas methanolica NBRC 104435]